MKNLIRLIVIIAAIGATPERLTLEEFSYLYKGGLYNLKDLGEYARDYKRELTPVGWGLLGHRWIPFAGGMYFDGSSSGELTMITKLSVAGGTGTVESMRFIADITTNFTPLPIPVWPAEDPNQPPEDIVELTEPADPNDLILQAEIILAKDPNNPSLIGLVELLKAERR